MIITRYIMDSLLEMFGQSSIQIWKKAIKHVYNAHMNEEQSIREHVLNMIVHFNVVEMNQMVFDEQVKYPFS